MADVNDQMAWDDEDKYWRESYRTRPYASSAGQDYEFYQPGYRYGYNAAQRYQDRSWDDVETDLSREWNTYEYRGNSTWEQMKAAARDAWDRITGKRGMHTR